ncbi:CLUMA_CG007790, isoform A [Clunio marinus]|uniref:CLUMA_CG007790, isoform A n=1 Tax=Clunio marinus TaxID=568069 RepID=A0A1J1I238_9DIPT|nr:CLUMA_CG007790, isoform A [Clunio marinus]
MKRRALNKFMISAEFHFIATSIYGSSLSLFNFVRLKKLRNKEVNTTSKFIILIHCHNVKLNPNPIKLASKKMSKGENHKKN